MGLFRDHFEEYRSGAGCTPASQPDGSFAPVIGESVFTDDSDHLVIPVPGLSQKGEGLFRDLDQVRIGKVKESKKKDDGLPGITNIPQLIDREHGGAPGP